MGPPAILLVATSGIFVADRINKLPLVLAFLGSYFLFFAFFMLDDPPTCPVRYRDQIQFALIIAATCYVVLTMLGAVYFLPAGLLAGNIHEACRRQIAARRRRRARAAW